MSIRSMQYVFESKTTKGSDRLMLLAIADRCSDEGECYPGIKTLAKKTNVSKRQAVNIIQNLERLGELRVVVNDGIKTGHGQTNRYVMVGFRESINLNSSYFKFRPVTAKKDRKFPNDENVSLVKPVSPDATGNTSSDATGNTSSDATGNTQFQVESQVESQEPLSPSGDSGVSYVESSTGLYHIANKSGGTLCRRLFTRSDIQHPLTEDSKVCKTCSKKQAQKFKKSNVCQINDGMTAEERGVIFDWLAENIWGYNPDEFKLLSDDIRNTAGGRIGKIIKALRKINHSYGTKLGLEYIKPFWSDFQAEKSLDLKSDTKWQERYLAWYMQQKELQERKQPTPDYRQAPSEDTPSPTPNLSVRKSA